MNIRHTVDQADALMTQAGRLLSDNHPNLAGRRLTKAVSLLHSISEAHIAASDGETAELILSLTLDAADLTSRLERLKIPQLRAAAYFRNGRNHRNQKRKRQ